MKKFIIFLAVLVTLLLVVAMFIPIIFKDDLQKAIRQSLNESIDAQVYFDPSKFGLTLFRNFPNPTASVEDFGVIGVDEFEGDTLLSAGSFDITIDLFSLFGNTYEINSINLVEPRINILVLQNGKANYEIVTESEEDLTEEDGSSSGFNLSIDHWNISDGQLRYWDKSLDFQMVLEGLNHTGSGNISLDNYDLSTLSNIERATVHYDGITYLSGQKLFANAALHINLPEFKFTFKDNVIRVNDFPVSFEGHLAMPSDDVEMDLSFSSANSSIKSLYSLIPGAYTAGYEAIASEGEMSFSGFVKGVYNDNSIPAYNVSLKTSKGMISYPDLQMPIKNIDIDMIVDCKDGNIDNTRIEIKRMHMDIGSNPLDASLLVRNLRDYSMKANVKARLDLAELSTIFPMEGLDMKGLLALNLHADGIYDSIKSIMPSISATMSIENGYLKSNEFPKALENMSFFSSMDCQSGNMEDLMVNVEDFAVAMGDDKLSGSLLLTNMVDYNWDLIVRGNMDLEVISEVFPIENMKYSGILSTDIETNGKYSDVEGERYDRFPTRGKIGLRNFNYTSAELPQGMIIAETSIIMDPQQLKVASFDGTIGKSDLKLNGIISNYIDYIFNEKALLKGEMNLNSNVLDVNEWMTGEETTANNDGDSTELELIIIPKNIDLKFNSAINNIYYDNLNLQNAKGLLTIHDGVLDMSNLSFNLMGGAVVMNGKYDTRLPERPAFNYQLNVTSLSIPDAFTSFSAVKTFAPMAKHMNGKFSTNFNISGLLKNDMTPIYESLNGKGLVQIAEAYVKKSKLVSGISGFMKSDMKSDQLSLKDVIMKTSLENGRAHVAPFDLELGGQKANLSGSIGADGTLDYYVSTEVEAGAIGQQVNQLLAGLSGQDASSVNSKIKLNFNVGGTYEKPKILLAGTTSADGTTTAIQEQVKAEVKQEVDATIDSIRQEAEQKVQDETAILMEKGEEQLQQQLDTLKKELTKDLKDDAGKVLGEELDSTTEELKNSLKNLFRKKKEDKN